MIRVAAPIAMSALVQIRPQNITTSPSATKSGLIVLYGMMMPSSSAVLPVCELMRALSWSASLPSPNGQRDVTVGILAKLYSGGGLGIVHSRVPAPHGFEPAISPLRRLLKKL